MSFIVFFYKSMCRICDVLCRWRDYAVSFVILKGNGVLFHSFKTTGRPYVVVSLGGTMHIGDNFSMNNGIKGNPIGCNQRCTFFVGRNASLSIGKSVGMSQTALVAIDNIIIDDYVKLGGGVCLYTTDFHSLIPQIRMSSADMEHRAHAPIHVKRNAFIGAHVLILKGVTIGENSIVGAGSVVTKSIPDNQIWAGNPAKYIRDI